jgi:hypothetical protein
VAGLECDALALIVVRLKSAESTDGRLSWHPWHEAVGAEPHGLSPLASTNARGREPFKRYPGGGSPYFGPHVERALFPSNGSRQICCPGGLFLDISHANRPTRIARIELLERLATPLDSGGTLGLIHLSLCPSEEEESGPDETLSWASAIRTAYLKPSNPLGFHLRHGDEEIELERRPLRRLVEELFGDPHPDLDRHFYTALMADYPPEEEYEDPELQRAWRHALAIRSYELSDEREDDYELEKEAEQTIRIAGATALVLRNCAVFTSSKPIDGEAAKNFRSHWAESLVFGLLQQSCIEEFPARLAEMGAHPHKADEKKLGELHDSWLSFRNLLWWSQPSATADPPRELLALLRRAQGTGLLFRDLEEDMVTYSDLHHREVEDRQAAALTNLQVYGSGIVVLSTLATVYALLNAHGAVVAILIATALTVAVAVPVIVYRLLHRRWPDLPWDRRWTRT